MTQLLVLHNSLNPSASASRAMTEAYLTRVRAANPEARVIERDLAADPLPHLPPEIIPSLFGQPAQPGLEAEAAALSDALITELEQSDVIVLGAPFYNFTIPSTLKSWLDYVIRGGRTFRYTETGPEGLLPPGKRVLVFTASGGVYSAGPAAAMDHLVPYLKVVLGLIGLTDIEVVRAEGMKLPDAAATRAAAIARAAALAA
ncbi:FMN-dependent NADH-azoreductase [Pseudoxanthomonas sp. GM95]|uniref:FMN-dependent NADH-azoreductase n=1 Tax=Pseudoxanthomonas sp. GM95 TaxID=1881043 RepID=UPI0008BB6B5B|nr:NAD(P)H-dependent oxidoreductase [Pseudoxanthomonas sp. GM95]SEM18137.1 FMN-dependent NADH-azoreductase [Pseudoxanthomonas sp. GM95]